MSLEIFCMTGELAGRRYRIHDAASIGSAPDNDIVLDATTVSRHHAKIARDEAGTYRLEDLGSSNGTRLDGDLVRGAEALGDLNVITFAEEHDFIVRQQPAGARP